MNRHRFYVYIYFRPNGVPCYVGKGCRSRWIKHERDCHNPHLAAIIRVAGGELPKVKIREGLTHDEAIEIERAFILAIGREPYGPLVNQTDGGEGMEGWSPSQETRAKMRLKWQRQDHNKREQARLRVLQSPEHRAKMSALQKGRPLTPEWKAKVVAATWGRKHSPEAIERSRQGSLGKKRSAEARAKMSAARRVWLAAHPGWKRGPHSEETKELLRQKSFAAAARRRIGQSDAHA